MTTPEKDVDFFTGASRVAYNPSNLRRIFLLLTRANFSDPKHYGDLQEQFKKFLWSKDDKLRTLAIELDYVYDPKKLDRLPAIFVGTDDLAFAQKVADNYKGNNKDNSGKEYYTEGGTNIILRHVSGTPDEAYSLASLSSQFFLGIRPLMQEKARFTSYNVVKLLSSKPFMRGDTQADQQFIVDLLISVTFNAIWMSVVESHRIKQISWKTSLESFLVSDKVQAT